MSRGILIGVTTRMTRQQKREVTRSAIVEAAEVLFAEHGYWGVSLDEIADHAGLTKGAVYSNFASKEDLLLAVGAKQAFRLDEADFPDRALPFRDQVRAFGRLIAEASTAEEVRRIAPRELEMATLALQSDRFRDLLVHAARRQSQSLGATLMERAAEQQVDLTLDPGEIGALLTAVRVGLTRMRLLSEEDIPIHYFEDAFERIVLG